MKTNQFFSICLATAAITFTGCQKEPTVCFDISNVNPDVGEEVLFTNCSVDADHYLWTFSDGQELTAENVSYTAYTAGTYTVTLTAYSKNEKKFDEVSETISVAQPTGSVSFWQSGTPAYYYTDVTIDGITKTIDLFTPSGISDCSTTGCANFTLNVGTYSYSADEQAAPWAHWSGTITITKDGCTTMQLQ